MESVLSLSVPSLFSVPSARSDLLVRSDLSRETLDLVLRGLEAALWSTMDSLASLDADRWLRRSPVDESSGVPVAETADLLAETADLLAERADLLEGTGVLLEELAGLLPDPRRFLLAGSHAGDGANTGYAGDGAAELGRSIVPTKHQHRFRVARVGQFFAIVISPKSDNSEHSDRSRNNSFFNFSSEKAWTKSEQRRPFPFRTLNHSRFLRLDTEVRPLDFMFSA